MVLHPMNVTKDAKERSKKTIMKHKVSKKRVTKKEREEAVAPLCATISVLSLTCMRAKHQVGCWKMVVLCHIVFTLLHCLGKPDLTYLGLLINPDIIFVSR